MADSSGTEGGGRGTATENDSILAEYFEFSEYETNLRTEIIAGVTTFLTMSYIIILNPIILTGVPGENPGIIIRDASGTLLYSPAEVRQMLAVVTILASAVAIFVMALYAKRPFGLAPGLGLNAFFAFVVVGALGVPWQTALAAVVTEGIVFILLTLGGARKYIIELFPEPVRLSVGTAIGLFLAIIGLQGMQIVVADPATLVSLGNIASNPVAIVSIVGLFITFVLYASGLRGSILLGIFITALLGWLATVAGLVEPGVLAPASFPDVQYDFTPLLGAFIQGFQNIEAFGFALIVFTFFFVDFFDTAGSLTGVGQAGGLLDEDGMLPDIEKPLMADAIGTTVGGILGTSTITTFIESASGVEVGGRTGMTALVLGLLFLVTLIFVPLIALVPSYASYIALVAVALIMLQNVTAIQWDKVTHAVPAGMTILIMPFTYSISYGIAAGIVSYPLVKVGAGEWRDVSVGQWILAGAFVFYFFVRTSGVLQATV